MKTYKLALCFLAGVFFSLGCATAPERPEWVSGNAPQYSPEHYLIGRGEANSAALARDRARSDLAKNFQVQVSEESRDLLSYSSTGSGEGASNSMEQEVSRSIVTRTDQVVEGVRVVEQWRDEESGEYYALAVLDRLQAANQLRRLVSDLDREAEVQMERARSNDDVLIKIGAASKALAAQVERRHYERYLRVVDRTGIGVVSNLDPVRMKADLADLMARVRVATTVEEDAIGGLQRAGEGALAAAGFVPDGEGKPTHILNLRSTAQETAGKDGWHWVRGSLEITLRSADNGSVLGTHSWPIKASAQQADLARARATEKVDALLKTELRDVIVGFGVPNGG